jgi:hypothetical protein
MLTESSVTCSVCIVDFRKPIIVSMSYTILRCLNIRNVISLLHRSSCPDVDLLYNVANVLYAELIYKISKIVVSLVSSSVHLQRS